MQGPMAPLRFCVAKRKKGDKRKKERVSKQKLLNGCHQGQNIIVLTVLERLVGPVIEYDMKNIFLEKSYTKCGGKTIPRPFSKKSKLSISLDQ